jgi:hypothetical protein
MVARRSLKSEAWALSASFGWQASRNPTTGAIAQLGERLLCKQEVVGSIPSGSTSRDLGSSSEEMKFVSVRIMDSRELKARGNCGGA